MRKRSKGDYIDGKYYEFLRSPMVHYFEDEKDPQEIDFDNEKEEGFDIVVMAHQPGIGKTYNVKEYMKKNQNTFYFTKYHDSIEDTTKDFGQSFTHWWGFKNMCPYSSYKSKVKKGVPAWIVCRNCKKKRSQCDYWKQFKDPPPVFAVFEHLSTRFKERIDKNEKPDIVFLDESKLEVSDVDSYKYERKNVKKWLSTLGYTRLARAALNPEKNCNYLLKYINGIRGRYYKKINDAIKKDNNTLLDEVLKCNPNEIERYLKEAKRYNDFSKEYTTPLWYHAFDLIDKDILLVVLDANFNKYWFNLMLEFYREERGFKKKRINIKIYRSIKYL